MTLVIERETVNQYQVTINHELSVTRGLYYSNKLVFYTVYNAFVDRRKIAIIYVDKEAELLKPKQRISDLEAEPSEVKAKRNKREPGCN